MNAQLLKNKIKENGMNVETFASKIGINKSTMYRKLNLDIDTTVAEANEMKRVLSLSKEDAEAIFFS